jgi:hypothetical protein
MLTAAQNEYYAGDHMQLLTISFSECNAQLATRDALVDGQQLSSERESKFEVENRGALLQSTSQDSQDVSVQDGSFERRTPFEWRHFDVGPRLEERTSRSLTVNKPFVEFLAVFDQESSEVGGEQLSL